MPPGAFELIIGLALLLPSAWFLIWLNTDPDAGLLMIIGAFMAIAAFCAVVAGAVLVLGGGWGLADLPARGYARLLGAGLGLLLARRLLNWGRRPRRKR